MVLLLMHQQKTYLEGWQNLWTFDGSKLHCIVFYYSALNTRWFYLLQGIVGTTAGTLWYINWSERASIRLVSGHHSKVRTV